MPTDDRPRPASGSAGAVGVPPVELRVLRALRRIIRAVELHSRRLAHEHAFTAPQLVCLLAIVEGPTTTSGLAREIHLSPSTVVGIVDRLESRGLITRRRDTADRRIVHLEATEAGRRAAVAAPSPLQDKLGESLARLGDLERATIAMSLERVVDLMEAGHLKVDPVLGAGEPPEECRP